MQNLLMDVSKNFIWAVGIENTFIPHAKPGLRSMDQFVLTQHDQQWQTDLELVTQTGAKYLRWGIPWYKVQPKPDQWDWAWVDKVLDEMVIQQKITPILDLMHYGTPLWLENSFLNSSYPQRVQEYTARVVERYHSLVKIYTPFNEPMVCAEFCGYRGEWPPYLQGEDGYVKIALAVARGMTLTTQTIRQQQPDALLIQVEARWSNWTKQAQIESLVQLNNAKQNLVYDLCTGKTFIGSPLQEYIETYGMTQSDLQWFQDNSVSFDIFGANFYPWSYGEMHQSPNGTIRALPKVADGAAIKQILKDAYLHSGLPVMVTETSANAPVAERKRWMEETITAVKSLRAEGIPVLGYTWFPLFTMIDWAYRRGRKPLKDYLLHLGMYDSSFNEEGVLERRPTKLVTYFQDLQHEEMPPVGAAGT